MPGDLYWDDTLAWSERQSALLRRLAGGERVNDVDWEHVIEEIEDVGKTELRACESLLQRSLEHLIKLHQWPQNEAARHWRGEILAFLSDARRAFSPSMRQKIDLADLYAQARAVIGVAEYGTTRSAAPDCCPVTLDGLLMRPADLGGLLAQFSGTGPS